MKFWLYSSIVLAVAGAGCGTQSGDLSDARVSFIDDAAVPKVDAIIDAAVNFDGPAMPADGHSNPLNPADAAPGAIDAQRTIDAPHASIDAPVVAPPIDASQQSPIDASQQPPIDAPSPSIDASVADAAPSIDAGRPTHINAIPTGSGTWQVVTGDFNADGLDDLAVSNFNDGTVTILIANFVDGFEPAVNYAVGVPDGTMAVGDLNNDGILDIVVPKWGGNVALLLGNADTSTGQGDGTFTRTQTDFADGATDDSYAIGIDDLNGDGIPDIVIASAWDGHVSILLGSGDATYVPFVTVPTGVLAVGLSVADYNFDGALDIAVTDTDRNTFGILFGNLNQSTQTGDGTFASISQTFTTDVWPVTIESVDLNHDGLLDIVTVNQQSADVGVFMSVTPGIFADEITYPVTTPDNYPSDCKLADVNGDGVLDIIEVASGTVGDLAILFGNADPITGIGDGTFAPLVNFPVGTNPYTVAIGDFNGDGALDIATGNHTDGTVSILLGDGTGNFH